MNIFKLFPLSGLLVATMTGVGCGKKDLVDHTRVIPVAVCAATEMDFSDTLQLQGSVVSEHYALVPAKTGGTIEELLVKEGDWVKKDQPLARLDAEKSKRVLESRREELAVAKSSLTVARAQEEQAATSLDLAAKDYHRYRKLSDDEAISKRQFDVAETQWKYSEAAYTVAKAQVELAEARVKQAEAALAIAENDAADTTVRAPIDGSISRKFRELGEMMESGKPIFRIDNPDSIEISVFIPAGYFNRIEPGKARLHVRVNGLDLGDLPVTYRSPTIDEILRTFEVKALLTSPPQGVVAGSMADVEVILTQRSSLGVPADAVLIRDGHSVVFAIEGTQAREYPVKTGLQTDSQIEILEGLPTNADRVVVQGQDQLNDGDTVSVTKE